MVKMKLQFKEDGQKRYYDFSSRVLPNRASAIKMKIQASRDFPSRTFRIKKKYS